MKPLKALCLCALWTLFVISSCGKQPEPEPIPDPSVTINTPTTVDIAADITTATISFVANRDWTVSSSEGWCTVSPSSGKAGEGAATITVTLEPNDTYEPRTATITIKAGGVEKTVTVTQAAAEQQSITTLQSIDLGLSVYWADRNLGAADVADPGNYYAWGETEPKDKYDWSNYKWANGNKSSLTKYNTRSAYGSVDDLTRLLPEDDAAVVATDGEWRMPTRAEFEELLNNCQWEKSKKTTSDGVEIFGYQVTGNSGGNVIFLPAAGGIIGTEFNKRGEYGLYPTSDLCTTEKNYYGYGDDYCWYYFFQSGERIIYGDSRARGWTIRPVKSKPQK